MANDELFEYERCENCQAFMKLKHNFTIGFGYDESYCCVLFAKEKDGFVVETTRNDMCECFQRRIKDGR